MDRSRRAGRRDCRSTVADHGRRSPFARGTAMQGGAETKGAAEEDSKPAVDDAKAAAAVPNGDGGDGDGESKHKADKADKADKAEKAAVVDPGPAPKFENKEDAVAAFKELLESKCTSHKMTWAEVVPLVSSDPRWRAVKSTGEKKNLFQHLMAQKQREAIDQVSCACACVRACLRTRLRWCGMCACALNSWREWFH